MATLPTDGYNISDYRQLAAKVLGESGLGRQEYQPITRAFGLALRQHSACFYDGLCERSSVWDAVKAVGAATRSLDRVCRRLTTMRPETVDEFAGAARRHRRQR
jgi:hypothetical protein